MREGNKNYHRIKKVTGEKAAGEGTEEKIYMTHLEIWSLLYQRYSEHRFWVIGSTGAGGT